MGHDYSDQSEDFILLTPRVEEDDVRQEAELLRLEGKEPSKKIIRRRLLSRNRVLSFYRLFSPAPPPWARSPAVNTETLYQLVTWAMEQTRPIQEVIWTFLETPDDLLTTTVEELQRLGVIQPPESSSSKRGGHSSSLAQLILRSLPATLEDLTKLVQTESPETRRPAATVRQVVRRYQRKGEIRTTKEGVVEWVT